MRPNRIARPADGTGRRSVGRLWADLVARGILVDGMADIYKLRFCSLGSEMALMVYCVKNIFLR